MTEFIKHIRDYAIEQHSKTNHVYDNKPYSFHLNMIYNIALKYIYLIPIDDRENVLAACFCHDLIIK
jgi:hypothetical protein